jgi:hypothetical protein
MEVSRPRVLVAGGGGEEFQEAPGRVRAGVGDDPGTTGGAAVTAETRGGTVSWRVCSATRPLERISCHCDLGSAAFVWSGFAACAA